MNRFLLCFCHLQYLFRRHPVNSFRSIEFIYQGAFRCFLSNGFREFGVSEKLLIPSAEFNFRAKTGSRMKMGIVLILLPVNIKVYDPFRDVHLKESDLLLDSVDHQMSGKLRWRKPPIFESELSVNPKHNVGVLRVVEHAGTPTNHTNPLN